MALNRAAPVSKRTPSASRSDQIRTKLAPGSGTAAAREGRGSAGASRAAAATIAPASSASEAKNAASVRRSRSLAATGATAVFAAPSNCPS